MSKSNRTPVKNSKRDTVAEFHALKASSFSGPMPPPEMLSGYEEICPGIAERLLRTYEDEVAHRQGMERALVETEIQVQKAIPAEIMRGQIFAFIICMSFLVAGTFLISNGHEISGAIFGGGGLAGIVTAFLASKKNNGGQSSP
jgi:uncharacterized membrane protein